jgi:hypothetical protein
MVRRTISLHPQEEQLLEKCTSGDILQLDRASISPLISEVFGTNAAHDFDIDDRRTGLFNCLYMVRLADDRKVALRMPSYGRPDAWPENDAFMLRSQALTMKYVKRKIPGFPIPEVVAWSNTCENPFGYPYILTAFINGVQAIS